MTTEITAVNTAGADVKESNAVTPIESIGPQATMHGLRFDNGRTTYLNRTPGVEGNRKTWTWSSWFKISEPSSSNRFFTAGNGTTDSTFLGFLIRLNDVFTLEGGSTIYRRTSSVFNDVSTWYHLVVAFDTTQASGSDRIKIYIDGVQLTSFATSNDPPLNSEHPINSSVIHDIGANRYGGSLIANSDFYLSDVYFVDGQALEPTAFGAEFEGKWGPLDSSVVKTNIGDFGANGFFLPFDPAATGEVWGSGVAVTVGAGLTDRTPANMFNGDLSYSATGLYGTDNGLGNQMVFTSPTAITVNSSVSIICNGVQDFVVTTSAGTFNGSVNSSGANAEVIIPANGTLTSISFTSTSATNGANCAGIKVDGELLVDYNNIGVDASGNDNHFHDSNFNLSQGVRGSWASMTTGDFNFGRGADKMFTPFTGTGANAQTNEVNKPITFTPTSNVDGDIVVYVNSTNYAIDVTVNSVNYANTKKTASANQGGNYGVEFPNAGKVTSIVINRPSGASTNCNGITLNGEPLVDSIFSTQDTVLDTPMNNYAVLETGTNGNLVASANGTNVTYMGDAGVDYYYEADGTGAVHTGGTAFSSTSGVTYNFGQQPFAAEYDYSKKWSDGAKTGSSIDPGVRDWAQAFDGVIPATASASVVGSDPGEYQITLANPRAFTKSCRIYAQTNPNNPALEVKVNGTTVNSRLTTSLGWADVTDLVTSPLVSLSVEGETGRSTYIGAIEVDGEILVDSDAALVEALNNNLYQTWLEWNDVATFLADNPAHVLTYQTIEAALESYEGNRDAFRTALRSRLIADGYLATEVEVLGL